MDLAKRLLVEYWPPLLAQRPPLYPAVLAVFLGLGGDQALPAVVIFQRLLWLGSGVLVFGVGYLLSRSLLSGVLAGLAFYTVSEVFSMTQLVYAETLAIFLSLAAALSLVAAFSPRERERARWLSAVLALGTAYARPVFQVLLPLLALFAVVGGGSARRRRMVRAVPFLVVGFAGLAPWYIANYRTYGAAAFVDGAGKSFANYLGDRRLLGQFPPGLEAVEEIYRRRFTADPTEEHVPWWEVADEWRAAYERRTGRPMEPCLLDTDMGRVTVRVLWANPDYYLARWLVVWRELSTSPWIPVRGRWSPISLLNPAWRIFWRYAGLWAPPVLLLLETFVIGRRSASPLRALPIATYLVLSFVNTAIEPWPGQIRYRTQVDAFLVVALGLAPTGLGLACRFEQPRRLLYQPGALRRPTRAGEEP